VSFGDNTRMDIDSTIRSAVVFLAPLAAGILALVASVLAFRMRAATKPSRVGVILAMLPALLMAGLFYSLAIHMHHVLGGWPTSIGERSFPPSLITHGQIAFEYFTVLFLISVLVWPIAFLLCLFIRRFGGLPFPIWARMHLHFFYVLGACCLPHHSF
jgi:hypothetical protein